MTTLPLQTKIQNSEQISHDIRINEVRFDGYVQRSSPGMRNYTRTRALTFIGLTTTEKNTLESYLTERAGWQDIDYDGEVWVCKQHSSSRIQNASQLWQYNCTLEKK